MLRLLSLCHASQTSHWIPRRSLPAHGAVYHVISRGNDRKELFLKAKTGESFERCLFEAVERCEWSELKELNEAMWEGLVEKALAAAGKTETDLQSDPKRAPWKAKITRELRTRTTAGNPWIAKGLNWGHPSRVTNLIHEHSK